MPQSGRNCCDSSMDNAVCGGGKAHGVCCPGRGTAARRKKAFLASFLCLTKRMEKFRRGFYWFVRSCGCGVPIRGLQNLGAAQKDLIGLCEVVIYVRCSEVWRTSELSRKGNGFILFACTKRTKSTPEVCEPLDSGDDSNRRSIRCFCENDRHSSGNRQRQKTAVFRVSPAMI